MERHGRTPFARKRYGQHFLTDANIVAKILRAAELSAGDDVVEVGPGRGALTGALLESGARVVAVEVDTALAEGIRKGFAGASIEVINADALKVSYVELARERGVRFKVVSNLPYNISGPILAKFLAERSAFTLMVLMFQKEVAERITARPGTKQYGALSVLAQVYTDASAEFDVPAHLFVPRPKVTSTVVSLRVRSAPRVEIVDEAFFRTAVRAAFSTRRKMLPNALKTLGLEKEAVLGALSRAGIDPSRRAETLSLDEFGALVAALWESENG